MTAKTALVTRPQDDSVALCAALTARGYGVRLEPMLDIVLRQGVSLDLSGVQGFLATSANGVRALAANCSERDLPLWAVGDATARCARDLGFSRVESANGDAATLTALVADRVDSTAGMLLHAAGTKIAGDLSGGLAAKGFKLRREVLYDARTAQSLTPALLTALEGQEIDLALFFSPRTAATFVTLAQAAGRIDACRAITAYALSAAVAQELAALPWRAIQTADQPKQDALLALIDREEGKF